MMPPFAHTTLLLSAALFTCTAFAEPLVFEAEAGALIGGVQIAAKRDGFIGSGYVTHFKDIKDAVDITVTAPAAGFYTLSLRYAADGDKFNPVFVNGAFQRNGMFPKSHGFAEMVLGRIALGSGANVIRIGKEWGDIDLDSLRIEPAPEPVPFHISTEPVFAGSSPEVRQLLKYLNDVFQKKIISGQQGLGDIPYILERSDGKEPMLLGTDLLFYSATWNQPNGDGAVERTLDWYKKNHGLVTVSWHWYSPFGATDQVWNSFYTDKTKFDVSRIADENSAEYKGLVAGLDHIAIKLKILRDAHVPILWRPLHEAEGKWFWWGAKGPEACKKLYRLMYDRFTRIHKLDNLIWVWTTGDTPNSIQWYPGDDCVDIVGADLYPPKNSHGSYLTVFDNIRRIFQGRKMVALTENGTIPDPDLMVKEHADWLWFLTWDKFTSDPSQNAPELVSRTFNHEHVIVKGKESPLVEQERR